MKLYKVLLFRTRFAGSDDGVVDERRKMTQTAEQEEPWWKPPLDGPAMDFGCGTRCLTMALRDGLGERVVGVDISQAMLDQFERKAERQGVTTAAVELTGPGQLGKDADSSFALIYTCLALHHVQDRERIISALITYLRSGGRLLVYTHGKQKFFSSDSELEQHYIHKAELRAWCKGTGILVGLQVERLPVHKEDGVFDSSRELDMLAHSCVGKVPDEEETDSGGCASCA